MEFRESTTVPMGRTTAIVIAAVRRAGSVLVDRSGVGPHTTGGSGGRRIETGSGSPRDGYKEVGPMRRMPLLVP